MTGTVKMIGTMIDIMIPTTIMIVTMIDMMMIDMMIGELIRGEIDIMIDGLIRRAILDMEIGMMIVPIMIG